MLCGPIVVMPDRIDAEERKTATAGRWRMAATGAIRCIVIVSVTGGRFRLVMAGFGRNPVC